MIDTSHPWKLNVFSNLYRILRNVFKFEKNILIYIIFCIYAGLKILFFRFSYLWRNADIRIWNYGFTEPLQKLKAAIRREKRVVSVWTWREVFESRRYTLTVRIIKPLHNIMYLFSFRKILFFFLFQVYILMEESMWPFNY